MVHIYTGNGKGKTTCALGMIIRALGYDWRVCLIQFMKKDWNYGEIIFLKPIAGIDIFKYGTEHFVNPDSPTEADIIEAETAWEKSLEALKSDKYQLVVLDEINVALNMHLISLEKQLQLMEFADKTELVMTGRNADQQVIDKADLVTEMVQVKHYYQKGLLSRKGIEF